MIINKIKLYNLNKKKNNIINTTVKYNNRTDYVVVVFVLLNIKKIK